MAPVLAVERPDSLGVHRPAVIALGLLLVVATILLGCDSIFGPGTGDGTRYETVVAGTIRTCARSTDSEWYCWGRSGVSRVSSTVGEGNDGDWTRPTRLQADPGLESLVAGENFVCGLTETGKLFCWGRNESGQLALGYLRQGVEGRIEKPTAAVTDVRFSRLAASGDPTYMCGLDAAGSAYCWGNNFRLQLGIGASRFDDTPVVTAVLGQHNFTQIVAEGASTCALNAQTDYYCWGRLAPGGDIAEPELIVAGAALDTLIGGAHSRCGLIDETAVCNGENTLGELGVGDTEPREEGFAEVAGGLRFRQLSGGRVHFCGVTTDERAYCWGAGLKGRLGNGSTDRVLVPTAVQTDLRFREIAAGGDHTCGVTVDGLIYCWGSGTWGQLGTGSTEDQLTPVRVAAPAG